MRIGRTLPPAATPIGLGDLWSGLRAVVAGRRELNRFGSELKAHFGVRHCFLVSSGKAAFALNWNYMYELANANAEESTVTGQVKVGLVGKGMGPRISRADMAAYMLQQLQSREQVGKAPAISN